MGNQEGLMVSPQSRSDAVAGCVGPPGDVSNTCD